MNDGEPECNLYYITLSSKIDETISNIANQAKEEINDLKYFCSTKLDLLCANDIKTLYMKISSEDTITFSFTSNPVSIPDIPNKIDEAFWGLVKFDEFRKIIIDQFGKIKNVFEDNVRDYQGENPVNNKIDETLKSEDKCFFPILNNGVTIVSGKKVSTKGGTQFTIKNYQIVNGCQTSYTIFNNDDLEKLKNVYIPVKLIFTEDDDIKNKITVATNSQTKIEDESLLALLDFQKNLEVFFRTQTSIDTLYYERRNGQYNSQDIQRTKIISKTDQLKAISSMFLHLPHLASGYKGRLFNYVKDRLFKKDDKYLPYFVGSLCLNKIERLIRTNSIDRTYNKARYHILLILKLLIVGDEKFNFNSKDIEKKCEEISVIVKDDLYFLEKIILAISLIKKSKIDIEEKGALYKESNTQGLIDTYKSEYKKDD